MEAKNIKYLLSNKNIIKLNWRVIENEIVEIEAINFNNFASIDVEIDNVKILETPDLYGSFVVFEELMKSALENGSFLIFTSVSGIADDAGWDFVKVIHNENSISWQLEINGDLITYEFDRCEYVAECQKIEKAKGEINKNITIEPKFIIFPE